jgi:hypothetical protein
LGLPLSEPNGQRILPMYPSVLVLFLGRDVLGDEGSGSASGTAGSAVVSAGASTTLGAEGMETGSRVGSAGRDSMTGAVSTTASRVCSAGRVSTTEADV